MSIPKIIHQTWKTDQLSRPFDILSDSWKECQPDWEYKLWTDKMVRDFIKENHNDFLEKFDNYPTTIQRVDSFRYFLLNTIGGLYVDVDFECLENIEYLLADRRCVLGKEPKFHCERFGRDMILCNAFMAATPHDPFIEFVCNKVKGYPDTKVDAPIDVLNSTGPFLLTDAFKQYSNKEEVSVLESSVLYPITMFEKDLILNDRIDKDLEMRIDKASAIHYFWGNW